jgi:hypothetical protein
MKTKLPAIRTIKMSREEGENDLYTQSIGPSGVRALPLAADINEGGHYF